MSLDISFLAGASQKYYRLGGFLFLAIIKFS